MATNESIELSAAKKNADSTGNENPLDDSGLVDDDDYNFSAISKATLQLSRQNSFEEDAFNEQLTQAEPTIRPKNSSEKPEQFFANRNSSLEIAAHVCKTVVDSTVDGKLMKFWLLTEISSWDIERERLVYLTEHSVLVIKFDFIRVKLLEFQRYDTRKFDRLAVGVLKYPIGSLIPSRNQIGVRCMWNNQQELSFISKWNPLAKDIPWLTLMSHPLKSNEVKYTESYDVDDFVKSLTNQLDTSKCQIINAPIIIENYAGVVSAVANVSSLGFFKARGKLNF
ncbi:p63-regulated -like protein [Halotydeus destructor]|nr:p63-regulated -like protein [Halotydeus destructor]